MKNFIFLLLFSILPVNAFAISYFGKATETKTLECAKSEIMGRSLRRYPFPNFTQITKLKSTNISPFWMRKTSDYKYEAIGADGSRYHGTIEVSNYTRHEFINGKRIVRTNCRIHVPLCNDHIFGYYSFRMYDSTNSNIMYQYNHSCALRQKPLPRTRFF